MTKLPIFIICGKSALSASGGYSAYGHNLAQVLTTLGHEVNLIGFGDQARQTKSAVGTEYLVASQLVKLLLFLKKTELAGLPFFVPLLTKKIIEIAQKKNYKKYIVWGIGPWSYPGVWVKILAPKQVSFVADYFATLKRETWGAYTTTTVADYGLFLKIQYFLVLNILVPIYSLLEQAIFTKADLIITHYEHAEVVFKEQFRFDHTKIRRLRYFVEIFKRKAQTKLPRNLIRVYKDNLVVILVCRQDPKKGINYLLHAFKTVLTKIDHVKLILVGTGTALKRNKRLATKLGLDQDVIFTGFVADVIPLLTKASVFVYPAGPEGSGSLAILEAMKLGIPVVATRTDGIPEDITDGKTGVLVRRHDAKALARGILKILANPNWAKKIGVAGQKSYRRKFNFKQVQQDVHKVVSEFDKHL